MQTINTILNYLDGKKTYVTGLLAVALGVYYQNMELIMLGLVGMGLRSAIK